MSEEMIRAWLGWACGDQARRWQELQAQFLEHRPTEDEARGVRAIAHSLVVVPTPARETAADRHAKTVAAMFGPRPLLRGEVGP